MKKLSFILLTILSFLSIETFSQFQKGDELIVTKPCKFVIGYPISSGTYNVSIKQKVIYVKSDYPQIVVQYKDTIGIIYYSNLKNSKGFIFNNNSKEAQNERNEEKIRDEEQRKKNEIALKNERYKNEIALKNERYNDLIIRYGKTIATDIMSNKIWIGMTTDMAFESRGRPNNINKHYGELGHHEQWVYSNYVYLYFKNEKLTSWSEYK